MSTLYTVIYVKDVKLRHKMHLTLHTMCTTQVNENVVSVKIFADVNQKSGIFTAMLEGDEVLVNGSEFTSVSDLNYGEFCLEMNLNRTKSTLERYILFMSDDDMTWLPLINM